jgi:uncharacterized protein (TIGR00255 family)
MTGYARAEFSSEAGEFRAEIKSVNSKYCDVQVRLPKMISFMEIPLKNLVSSRITRGKAELTLDVRPTKAAQAPALNRPQFIAAMRVLEQMKVLGGLNEEIRLEHLLRFPDLIESSMPEKAGELELHVEEVTQACLDALEQMRGTEGANLAKEISRMLEELEDLYHKVKTGQDDVLAHWQERFKTRLQDFVSEPDMKDRIMQEAAIYAEKADIQEELVRIASHCAQFRQIMTDEFPAGKKLDFLCQELNREWNTIASKSSKTNIINSVIEAKSLVESIREQVQNVI